MNAHERDPARQTGRPGGDHTLAAGIGVAAAMILCCAGPVLIAAGALGAIAGFFSNPLVLLAAAALLLTGIVAVTRQRRPRRTEDCCPPPSPTTPRLTAARHRPRLLPPCLERTPRHHDPPPPTPAPSPAQARLLRPALDGGTGADHSLRQPAGLRHFSDTEASTPVTVTDLDDKTRMIPAGKPAALFFFSVGCGECLGGAKSLSKAAEAMGSSADHLLVDMDPKEPKTTVDGFRGYIRAPGSRPSSIPGRH